MERRDEKFGSGVNKNIENKGKKGKYFFFDEMKKKNEIYRRQVSIL